MISLSLLVFSLGPPRRPTAERVGSSARPASSETMGAAVSYTAEDGYRFNAAAVREHLRDPDGEGRRALADSPVFGPAVDRQLMLQTLARQWPSERRPYTSSDSLRAGITAHLVARYGLEATLHQRCADLVQAVVDWAKRDKTIQWHNALTAYVRVETNSHTAKAAHARTHSR